MKRYDAIIIGFGKGGKLLAAELANRNWKVAVIERSPEMYGGTCINVGCIPTKTMIHEAEFAERIYQDDYKKQSKLYSLALKRKDKLVTFLREKNVENLTGNPNITLYDGRRNRTERKRNIYQYRFYTYPAGYRRIKR